MQELGDPCDTKTVAGTVTQILGAAVLALGGDVLAMRRSVQVGEADTLELVFAALEEDEKARCINWKNWSGDDFSYV